MKKVLAVLLAGIMVLGSSVVGLAAEPEVTVMTEVWETVLDQLDEDMHGGLYYEDNVLHIKPVEEAEVQAVVQMAEKETRSFNSDIVVDEAAEYSYNELMAAKDTVFDNRDELGIYATGISCKNNSIRVIAEEWTDEKKQAVYDVAGIDNVLFEIEETDNVSVFDTPDRDIEENKQESKAVGKTPLASGTRIFGAGGQRTLGASAIMNGEEGFVTAGHGTYEGDEFTTQNSQIIGKVMKSVNEDSFDFAFIKRDSSSDYYLTRNLLSDSGLGRITRSRSAVEGAVVIIGENSGQRSSKIVDTSYNTGNPDSQGANKNLILFLPYTVGRGGDSGGPVLYSLGGNDYAICGLWKGFADGEGNDTRPIAVNWNLMRNQYDVQIY